MSDKPPANEKMATLSGSLGNLNSILDHLSQQTGLLTGALMQLADSVAQLEQRLGEQPRAMWQNPWPPRDAAQVMPAPRPRLRGPFENFPAPYPATYSLNHPGAQLLRDLRETIRQRITPYSAQMPMSRGSRAQANNAPDQQGAQQVLPDFDDDDDGDSMIYPGPEMCTRQRPPQNPEEPQPPPQQ